MQPLWTPSAERARASNMHAFREWVAARTGRTFADTSELHAWSVGDVDAFWRSYAQFAGVQLAAPPQDPRALASMPATEWFPGARLNYAENLFHGWSDDALALVVASETSPPRHVPFGELRTAVGRCSGALRAMDLRAGDRVAAVLPNAFEAVVLLLACASEGLVFSACSPDLGARGILGRFGQTAPAALFATDAYTFNGRTHSVVEALREVVAGLPSLRHVVWVPSATGACPPESWASRTWDEALAEHADATPSFLALEFDHPLYILYTSGTTGLPKCLVHRGGGALLKHGCEQQLHCDVREGDVVFWNTTSGWMMWNWLVSALAQRAAIVLYQGGILHPSPDALWRLADDVGVTHFGTSASHIHACAKQGLRPAALVALDKLRSVLSTGSPLSPAGFEWVHAAVKSDVHVASISGGTDVVGCFMLGDPTKPVYAGQIQGPALGVDLAVYDDDGRAIAGAAGELVIRQPIPSMPLRLFGDPDRSLYRETYLARFPGVWAHGDLVEITPQNGIVVHGRSDATLKPGGVRIGTAELYRPLAAIPDIVEALAAGKRDDDDVSIWLFVVLRPGVTLDRPLLSRIRRTILESATMAHVPREIFQVSDLPRTPTGKLVEIAVSRVINDQPPGGAAIANPTALAEIERIVEQRRKT